MADYKRVDNMFEVPEFKKEGIAYVVRTGGFYKKDPDRYWVCVGGLVGRPHSGPFRTAEEAETVRDRANAKPEPLYWAGTLTGCDICKNGFGGLMYDAKTKMGLWGNLCHRCFETHGVGLGVGLGQKYVQQESGRFLCTEGR